jgi:hypothetical protein
MLPKQRRCHGERKRGFRWSRIHLPVIARRRLSVYPLDATRAEAMEIRSPERDSFGRLRSTLQYDTAFLLIGKIHHKCHSILDLHC